MIYMVTTTSKEGNRLENRGSCMNSVLNILHYFMYSHLFSVEMLAAIKAYYRKRECCSGSFEKKTLKSTFRKPTLFRRTAKCEDFLAYLFGVSDYRYRHSECKAAFLLRILRQKVKNRAFGNCAAGPGRVT